MATRAPWIATWAWAMLLGASAVLDAGFAQSPRRICPVDEAVGDASLVGFREELQGAVKARDVQALRLLVDPEIVVGGLSQQFKTGFDAFLDHFDFRDRSNWTWAAVERILSQGGVMEHSGAFCAPYFTCPAPPYGWEPDEVVVLGDDVPVYARPDLSSPVVARLSCEVLRVAALDDLRGIGGLPLVGWEGVYMPGGGLRFIRAERVDSPGLYLRIGKKNGVWKLIDLAGTD